MSPANIQEALRMLADGKRFGYVGWEIAINNNRPMCRKAFVNNWEEINGLWNHVTKWQLIEEPEPGFPFKTWDRCLMRDHELQNWIACQLSHIGGSFFRSVNGNGWNKLTAYSDDLVGTDKTPSTPVWIVKDGKPEVLR